MLCTRYYTTKLILLMRGAFNILPRSDEYFQAYRNPMDVPDGYKSEYFYMPMQHRWEGFVDPVLGVRRHLLAAQQEPRTGRWVIRQDAMVVGGPILGSIKVSSRPLLVAGTC